MSVLHLNWTNMVLNSRNAFLTISKLIIQLWLLGLFLHFFGLPALERFHDKKVVVVTSTKESGGTPAPAVTIVVSGGNVTKSGWKESAYISGFVRNICNESNTTETIIDCIERQTYDISEVVKSVKFGLGYYSKKVIDPWIEEFSYVYAGRTYTLDINEKLRPKSIFANPLRILLKTNLLSCMTCSFMTHHISISRKIQTQRIQPYTKRLIPRNYLTCTQSPSLKWVS